MEQNTPVTLNIRPESFDLLMGILELNGKNAGDEDTRLKARYLLEKWRRFSRLRQDEQGTPYVGVRMHGWDSAEAVWQLLYLCEGKCFPTVKYSEQLTRAKDCGAEIDHLNLPSFPPEPT
ncbi:hypothetical protein [Acutalibacter sp. JLR.KK004]|uniref:hypothetical protein n=1 Tax=Acutalibacter sp. JLR.KK004 TaxID=3112622 RepID=UPI002FF313D9